MFHRLHQLIDLRQVHEGLEKAVEITEVKHCALYDPVPLMLTEELIQLLQVLDDPALLLSSVFVLRVCSPVPELLLGPHLEHRLVRLERAKEMQLAIGDLHFEVVHGFLVRV